MVYGAGRRLYLSHTRTQTGRCEGLDDLPGEETANISAEDVRKLGVKHGEYWRFLPGAAGSPYGPA